MEKRELRSCKQVRVTGAVGWPGLSGLSPAFSSWFFIQVQAHKKIKVKMSVKVNTDKDCCPPRSDQNQLS